MVARNLRRLAVVAALLLGAACGWMSVSDVVFTPAARPPAGMALVYVFRIDPGAAPTTLTTVRIDGKPVATLRAAEYSAVHLRAGSHTASLDPEGLPAAPARPLEFTVAPGQVGALALDYIRSGPDQPSQMIETKGGKMALPSRPAPTPADGPFMWFFIADVETSVAYPELRRRRMRASESPELTAN